VNLLCRRSSVITAYHAIDHLDEGVHVFRELIDFLVGLSGLFVLALGRSPDDLDQIEDRFLLAVLNGRKPCQTFVERRLTGRKTRLLRQDELHGLFNVHAAIITQTKSPAGKRIVDNVAGVTYCYDGAANGVGCSAAPTGAYLVGRLTMVQNPNSATLYTSFDALGRVTGSSQQTLGMALPYPTFSYSYDLAGETTSMTYPSGRMVTYAYDQAGRINAVQKAGGNYATGISYAPQGAISSLLLGNNLSETTSFNSRLQPVSMSLGSSGSAPIWSLQNTYGPSGQNNGNVTQQQIGATGMSAITQVYTYDGVNRLLVAAENPSNTSSPMCPDSSSVWCRQYSNDAFGNRTAAAEWNQGGSLNEPTSFNVATNQITGTGWSYDTVNQRGTVTSDPGLGVYGYDSEDRMVSANGTVYAYDGDGRRVMKTPPGGTTSETTWYVYDASGQLSAEYAITGPSEAGTVFLTADHLGSTRVVTNMVNPTQPVERHDYLPFGEEITVSTGNPRLNVAGYSALVNVPMMFTGKERDAETGLDYFGARYFSGAQGRFMSPDEPFADQDPANPRSWNLYGYVRNNPLIFGDPDGRECVKTADGSSADDGKGGGCSAAGVDANGNIQPLQVTVNGNGEPSSFSHQTGQRHVSIPR